MRIRFMGSRRAYPKRIMSRIWMATSRRISHDNCRRSANWSGDITVAKRSVIAETNCWVCPHPKVLRVRVTMSRRVRVGLNTVSVNSPGGVSAGSKAESCEEATGEGGAGSSPATHGGRLKSSPKKTGVPAADVSGVSMLP